jgi:hypothetical protein
VCADDSLLDKRSEGVRGGERRVGWNVWIICFSIVMWCMFLRIISNIDFSYL